MSHLLLTGFIVTIHALGDTIRAVNGLLRFAGKYLPFTVESDIIISTDIVRFQKT